MTKHTGSDQTDNIVRFLQEAFANGWTGVSFDNCVDSGVTLADLLEGTFLSSSVGSEQAEPENLVDEAERDRGLDCGASERCATSTLGGII